MADWSRDEQLQHANRLIEEGRLAEAVSRLRRIADRQPNDPEVFNLVGQCMLRGGDLDAALGAFQRAVHAKPDWVDPYLGAAEALAGRGDAFGSMQALLHVLEFEPYEHRATRQLLELLVRLHPDTYLSALEPALLKCFAHPEIDPAPLTRLCGQQLRLGIADELPADDEDVSEPLIAKMADNRLWHLYLSRVINTDQILERLFTRVRRNLCLSTRLEEDISAPVHLLVALARQCFLNEYVFDVSNEELERVSRIDEFLAQEGMASESAALAFVIGCLYRPPAFDERSVVQADDLTDRFDWLADLCRLAVYEPAEEAEFAKGIPTLHEVHHDTSMAVQEQYESNPYPRWNAPPTPPQADFLQSVRRRFSLRSHAQESKTIGGQVLVAGCGTGFEPIDIARRDPSLEITAVDLSRRSLAYAKRQAEAMGCNNIEFFQCDILDLPRSGRKFDLIICTGVLHHMADTLAGWKALCDVLASSGTMRISLYSKLARRSVCLARERIRSLGFSGTPDGIRAFRQWMMEEAQDRELAPLLQSEDFFSMSGCRDLLFHVQEQHFTVLEIWRALDQLDLRFCGFDPPNDAVLQGFAREYPDPGASLDLERWDRFEQANPDIFAGMYQFWCEPD